MEAKNLENELRLKNEAYNNLNMAMEKLKIDYDKKNRTTKALAKKDLMKDF